MKKTLLALTLILATSAYAQTLATVNGEKIDSSLIDQQVELLKTRSNGEVQDTKQLRNDLLEQAIMHKVITQEAKRLKLGETPEYKNIVYQENENAKKAGLDKSPTYKEDFEIFKENLLIEAYHYNILKNNPVTDKDVRKTYDDFTKYYKDSQEIRLAEIITNSENDAKQVISELDSGKNFNDMVKKYSTDKDSKSNGGLFKSYVNLKDLAVGEPKLYEQVKGLDKGQYTKTPLSANGIWAVFQVNDKRKASLPTFDSLKEQIEADLRDRKVKEAISKLAKKAKVKIN